jgi:hypothetical protein
VLLIRYAGRNPELSRRIREVYMAGEHQNELFQEFKKEDGKFKKIADKIIRRQQKLFIHIPLENAIFGVIIAIMGVIVAFALGVERGRHMQEPPIKTDVMVGRAAESVISREPDVKPVFTPPATAPEGKIQDTPGAYTIQLISYKKKRLAEEEKKRLSRKKIDSYIVPSGDRYQLCTGRYKDIADAAKALNFFVKDYKGCFVRKR